MNSTDALTFAAQAFVTLFVIMDPPGATPIFLGLVKDKTPRERVRLAWQAAAVSLFVIASFAIFGQLILDYMHVSIEALQAAGGLLLLYVALQLLTGASKGGADQKSDVQQADTNSQILGLALAIIAVHLIIGTVLMASTKIVGLIKESGVTLLASIAGLLLAAIAVQMLANAIKAFAAS
jgi:multiple antibiotic resistance protein